MTKNGKLQMSKDAYEDAVPDAFWDDAVLEEVLLLKTATPRKPGADGCWFGGRPNLPPNLEWPFYQSAEHGDILLVFLAQVNLATLPLVSVQTSLPDSGVLFFFLNRS